jgi:hypothetical protein
MSEPFTDISAWDSLQDRTAANEIVRAYNERRRASESFLIEPLLSTGSNAQDTTFWRNIQDWIISTVQRTSGDNRWLDHTQEEDLDGAEPSGNWFDEVPYYTLATWQANSGLTGVTGGGSNSEVAFRRATSYDPEVNDWTDYNDPMYSYGTIQSGDIRGPWIFEDLQKAFDALRVVGTYRANPISNTGRIRNSLSDPKDDLGDAISDAQDKWVPGWSNPSFEGSFMYFAGKGAFVREDGDPIALKFLARYVRRTARVSISTNPNIDNIARAYIYPVRIDEDYNDVDFTENRIVLAESFGSQQGSSRTVELIDRTTLPDGGPALDIPLEEDAKQDVNAGSVDVFVVIEHEFTNVVPEPE